MDNNGRITNKEITYIGSSKVMCDIDGFLFYGEGFQLFNPIFFFDKQNNFNRKIPRKRIPVRILKEDSIISISEKKILDSKPYLSVNGLAPQIKIDNNDIDFKMPIGIFPVKIITGKKLHLIIDTKSPIKSENRKGNG